MFHREKKISANPKMSFLDSDSSIRTTRSQRQEITSSLPAIKEVIAQEFIKFEQHFQEFKSDVCRTIENWFEAKLVYFKLIKTVAKGKSWAD